MRKLLQMAILFVLVLALSVPVQAQPKIDFVYSFPPQNSLYNLPRTAITLNSPQPVSARNALEEFISVSGDQSGIHTGKASLSADQKSIIFKPDQEFSLGETISVNVKPGIRTVPGELMNGRSLRFTIQSRRVTPKAPDLNAVEGAQTPNAGDALPASAGPNAVTSIYKTTPADFPVISVTSPANGTGDGYVFFGNWSFGFSQPLANYLLIVDNNGEPVYYQPMPAGQYAADFKKQPNGLLTYYDNGVFGFRVLDSSYKLLDTVFAQNGYETDIHEFKILPNGHMLLMIYDSQMVDMTAYGGLPDAVVIGLVIQELDPQKNVVFQWRSWDHLDLIPYTDSIVTLTGTDIDYVHGNAIEVDYDGNLLISNRHLSAVIKINRVNGDVMWILGGKGNQFDFGSDEGFSHQHDIRRLANGDITIFDNHNKGPAPFYSRAVEYRLDEYLKTATRVWQFRNTPDTFSLAMGSAQRLPNGNTVIGWGSANPPTVTEVKPDGSKAFELTLGSSQVSYRAFRFPWKGTPTTAPDLVFEAGGGTTTLYYSWNGATEIKSYKVYGGITPTSMTLLGEGPKTGFETSTDITAWTNDYCFFQVMPVDQTDSETQFSNQVFIPGPACHAMFFPVISSSD